MCLGVVERDGVESEGAQGKQPSEHGIFLVFDVVVEVDRHVVQDVVYHSQDLVFAVLAVVYFEQADVDSLFGWIRRLVESVRDLLRVELFPQHIEPAQKHEVVVIVFGGFELADDVSSSSGRQDLEYVRHPFWFCA